MDGLYCILSKHTQNKSKAQGDKVQPDALGKKTNKKQQHHQQQTIAAPHLVQSEIWL